MNNRVLPAFVLGLVSVAGHAQEFDPLIGEALEMGEPTEHWFAVRGRDSAFIIDGDAGTVEGTMTLSLFTPALEPHLDAGRVYAYGSFYSRTFYGDRTDLVLVYDFETAQPVVEIEIPPKAAGIGHSGMIGLIDERFVGVWNITPAMSVSLVDVREESFVGEISTPGCAGVYPIESGFLMICGDGRVQYVMLDADGEETGRFRSDVFFDIAEDPVYDYAVPTADGWLMMSLEGVVHSVSVDGEQVVLSDPWSINPPDEEGAVDVNAVPVDNDDQWRIGGRQPFAYNREHDLLVTLMHEGGGPETFEDAGTEVWGFTVGSQRRGYRLALDEESKGTAIELTSDEEPLLIIAPDDGEELLIHDALSSRRLRSVAEIDGSLIQNLD